MKIAKKIKFIISQLLYKTTPQIFIDATKLVEIRVTLTYIFQEGLALAHDRLPGKLPSGYTIRLADTQDLHHFLNFSDRRNSLEELQERFDQGEVCVAAWHDGRIAAFTWAKLKLFTGAIYRIPLKGDEAYLFDAYTAGEHRGHGLAVHLRYSMYKLLAERGRLVLYSTSNRYNTPALKFKNKLGAQIIHSVKCIDFFGRWKFGTTLHLQRLREEQDENTTSSNL
jgi:GNAT superfamily N-acetyltransferase